MTEHPKKCFFFEIECLPEEAAAQHPDIGGADAHVFVMAQSLDVARALALSHLVGYGWRASKIEHAVETQPEQIAAMDTIQAAAYRRAQREGLWSSFVAWPRTPCHPDAPMELRPMGRHTLDNNES